MQTIDTLIHADWIIPVEPENTIHAQHALAIHDGKVLEILPSDEARQRYQAESMHDLKGHVLIPGLVNTHTHAAMNLFRGLSDDLHLMEWLSQHIWPAEQKWVNEEFVHDGTQLAIAEMIRGGTTLFNDMYFFPEVSARAASQAGIRASIGLIVLDFPSAWAESAEHYINKGLELHDHYSGDALIKTAFAPHAPYTVSDEPFARIKVLADELNIPVHMHVHETREEIQGSLEKFGMRPIQRLHKLGLLSPNLLAVHMTQLEQDEIELIAANGVHVLHCPESNLKLASGFCAVAELGRYKVNVALGTDGAASNNDLDMIGEMRTAAILAKAVDQDASAVPAHQVLRMATINGARALGLDEEIGSLLPGKSADIAAIDLHHIETQPVYNAVSQLIYSATRNQVAHVWINGQHVLNDRELTTLDEDELLHKAREWQARIREH